MTRRIRPVTAGELPSVSSFLRTTFGEHATPRFAEVEVLRWKYFDSGPLRDGPRAYVVEQDGVITAFAGLTPAVFSVPGGPDVSALTLIDWAADRAAPGAGVALYVHLIRLAEAAFLIRGTDVTRSIAPKLGFRPSGDALIYACWIRPMREFMRRRKSLQSLSRLAHGLVHRPRNHRAARGDWRATRVDAFDARIEPVLDARPSDRVTCRRSVASLNHMLACPLVRMEGYVLTTDDTVRGYMLIGYLEWEARLVDVNIDSEKIEDWMRAYAAAGDVAGADPNVCRLRIMTGATMQDRALKAAGYWVNRREPISVYDPKKRLPAIPLDVQFFESDSAYT